MYLIVAFKFIYSYFEGERGQAQAAGGQREREREKDRGRIPSRLHTVSTESDVGLDLTVREIVV